jgi:oligopeptidase B
MLMGAVANMAPDAFGGIIAEFAFVDVLNTMLDDTLPLTPPEWPEWGNPIASKKTTNHRGLFALRQCDRNKPYPPMLAVAGLTDPRVTYWEPAKWVARLRQMSTSGNPVLFKINMAAGHAGASGRFQRLEEIAYEYAFALKVVGKV